ERGVIWWVPANGEKGGALPVERGARNAERGAKRADDKAGGFSLKDAQRVEIHNGIVLLLFETHRLPIVTAHAELRQVSVYEPEEKRGGAARMGSLLDAGTPKAPVSKIGERRADLGGSQRAAADRGPG